jgi:3-phenylpropionate/trans-cinnamate dioxygenase ferredoxin subunit
VSVAWVDVCSVDEVVEDRINAFDTPRRRILVMNTGGSLSAVDANCTHEDADLGLGFFIDGRIMCPLHLSAFDPKTGEVYGPPADRALAVYPLKTEGSRVLVDVP